MHHDGPAPLDVQHTLDRETELLMSAINMVASGGAPSTTIAGLRLAREAVEIVRPIAVERGVSIDPLWGSDEDATDVRVARLEADRAR